MGTFGLGGLASPPERHRERAGLLLRLAVSRSEESMEAARAGRCFEALKLLQWAAQEFGGAQEHDGSIGHGRPDLMPPAHMRDAQETFITACVRGRDGRSYKRR